MVKRLLIVLAAVVVFAAGCANSPTSSSSSAASGSSSGAASGSSSASGQPSAPGAPGTPSSGASGAPAPGASGTSTKLTGTLEEGVEPSCLVLRGAGRDHSLYFADPQVKKQAKIGDTVTVVGQARPTQMTTCQQGIPFLVEAMAVD
jgi:hypothetical protein